MEESDRERERERDWPALTWASSVNIDSSSSINEHGQKCASYVVTEGIKLLKKSYCARPISRNYWILRSLRIMQS